MRNRMPNDACRSASVEQVIRTVAVFGDGVQGDPVREVTQYWALDGTLLATFDPNSWCHATGSCAVMNGDGAARAAQEVEP